MPTAIFASTPLDCTFCTKDICPEEKQNINAANPNHFGWWIKKYCTFEHVDEFVLYFPYVLLVIALLLVLMERFFIQVFKVCT